jgi:hypothetical protein
MTLPTYEKLGALYLGRILNSATAADTPDLLLYDSRDLTTHAVCVGMTGSGKTGLCMALLEEAAIDGVPALVIDPKGDLANLMLTFPQLRREDFEPWVDAGEAARKNLSVADYAQITADTWRKGLSDWQQDGQRIARLRAAAEVAIYTPGSRVGRPLSLLRSFSPPTDVNDGAAVKERIGAAVGGLLGLVGLDADPLNSRDYIFLANLLEQSWRAGQSLDLAGLIQGIQKPPFDKVGVFDLETFYPAKQRLPLAMAINNLLAAPGFDAWLDGEPVDVRRLLYTESGKPRVAIVSIAHLNDAERMFVVTMLLNETVAWMRKQSGTSSLRALLYMDEIFGYFPPSAMPPSKIPLLTLMKQARAFGLGVVLATQNPIDLDYKGLSNAGTWFIGRLQTERDKARVIDGLLGADGALDKAQLEKLMAKLGNRVFLMRTVHDDAPILLRTRWALSYLRGPLTLNEIQKLTELDAIPKPKPGIAPAKSGLAGKPVIPNEVKELYAPPAGVASTYVPYLLGTVRAHFVDAALNVDVWQARSYLAPLADDGSAPDWAAAHVCDRSMFGATPVPALGYADTPAALLRAQNYPTWGRELADHIYQTATCDVFCCLSLKLSSATGESEAEFRARISQALREKRDQSIDKLRAKYAPRVATLTDQVRRAQERIAREQSQLSQQKVSAAISVGTAILGAFFGRKALSSTTLSRAGTAMRSGGRVAQESADVARAGETLEVLLQRLAALQAELENETARLQGELDPAVAAIETTAVKPRKADVAVTGVAIAWMPVA